MFQICHQILILITLTVIRLMTIFHQMLWSAFTVLEVTLLIPILLKVMMVGVDLCNKLGPLK